MELLALERHAVREPRRVRVGDQHHEEGVGQIVERLARRPAGHEVSHEGVSRALPEPLENRLPELPLAPPVIVERPEGHACPARDLAGRRARIPSLREDLLGGIEKTGGRTVGVVTGLVQYLLAHWSSAQVI